MAVTAFIVRVESAERLVGDLRLRFDESAILGVPPHITILAPFMAPENITPVVLKTAAEAFGSVSRFSFSLNKIGRWPETVFLAPSPQDPFIRLTQAIVGSFPDNPPYSGKHTELIPHLTVADGNGPNADVAEEEIQALLAKSGGVTGQCAEIELLENSSGQWELMHVIALPP